MHTKEPWTACEHSDSLHAIRDEKGRIVADVGYGATHEVNYANARRIVACVNACAGISTDNLEDNKQIIEGLRILNNHRKELLDALKYAAGALGTDGHDPIVDAAIAKAEAA